MKKLFKLNAKQKKILSIIILCLCVVAVIYFFKHKDEIINNINTLQDSISESESGLIDLPTASPTENSTENSIETQPVEISYDFDYSLIPPYSGEPWIEINNNIPFFTEDEIETYTKHGAFEYYNDLDELGRCTYTIAYIDKSLMPEDKRENIGSVTPTGWVNQKNEKPAVYNRCHLIGFQLTGENANKKNLVTGTRALNVDAMLPFENLVDDYIDTYNIPVLYRVTPYFVDDELVCRGIIMEGWTENGEIMYCIWCYNNQDGIEINYKTGEYIHTN